MKKSLSFMWKCDILNIINMSFLVFSSTVGAGILVLPCILNSFSFLAIISIFMFVLTWCLFIGYLFVIAIDRIGYPCDYYTLTTKLSSRRFSIFIMCVTFFLYCFLTLIYTNEIIKILSSLDNFFAFISLNLLFVSSIIAVSFSFNSLIDSIVNVLSIIMILLFVVFTRYVISIKDNVDVKLMYSLGDIKILRTIVMIFSSFGFYPVVPYIYKVFYNSSGKDLNLTKKKTIISITIGLIFVMLIELIWTLSILYAIDRKVLANIYSSGDSISVYFYKTLDSSLYKIFLMVIGISAIISSLIGILIGLKGYLSDLLKNQYKNIANFITLLIVLINFLITVFALKGGFYSLFSFFSHVVVNTTLIIMPMVLTIKWNFSKFRLMYIIGIMLFMFNFYLFFDNIYYLIYV